MPSDFAPHSSSAAASCLNSLISPPHFPFHISQFSPGAACCLACLLHHSGCAQQRSLHIGSSLFRLCSSHHTKNQPHLHSAANALIERLSLHHTLSQHAAASVFSRSSSSISQNFSVSKRHADPPLVFLPNNTRLRKFRDYPKKVYYKKNETSMCSSTQTGKNKTLKHMEGFVAIKKKTIKKTKKKCS